MADFPHYYQERSYTCGSAALRMAFVHHGWRFDEDDISQLTLPSREYGTSFGRMLYACKELGFPAVARTGATLDDARCYVERDIPVVVPYLEPRDGFGHYALLAGANGYVALHDPFHGEGFARQKEDFLENWREQFAPRARPFIAVGSRIR